MDKLFILLIFCGLNSFFQNENRINELDGEWRIINIGNSTCNSCPLITFFKNKKGKIFTPNFEEQFHWEYINSDKIRITILKNDTNTFDQRLLNSGEYNLDFSTPIYRKKKFQKVLISTPEFGPIITIMRNKD